MPTLPVALLRTGRVARAASLLVSAAGGLVLAAACLFALQAPTATQALPAALTYPGTGNCGTTLQHCINTAINGQTINIMPGLYVTSVTMNKAVSLVGAGVGNTILQALPGQRVLTVTVAMTSATQIANMTIQDGNAGPNYGGGLYLTLTAQPVLHNLLIFNNSAVGGGGVYAGSAVTLISVTVQGNTATGYDGGGMLAFGAVAATDSVFRNNTIITGGSGGGLAVYINFTGTNVSFLSNTVTTAFGFGGGLAVYGAAHVTGGLYQHNRVNDATGGGGGGLYANALVISGTQFVNNAATFGLGGGAETFNADPNANDQFTNVTFTRNKAAGGGGLATFYTATLTAVDFLTNTSTGFGGGLYAGIFNFPTSVSGGRFLSNTAPGGGGLYSVGNLTLTGTQFLSNTALSSHGGGIEANQNATLSGAYFAYNTVITGGNGGGIDTAGNLIAVDTNFLNNRALIGGGGGSASGGSLSLTNAHYTGNTANFSGGGALTFNPATIAGSQFLSNTTHNLGGGLSADSALVRDSLFQNNQANGSWGGGLYAYRSAAVTDTLFLGNASTSVGGGLAAQLGTCSVLGGRFERNSAVAGGGVYCAGPRLTIAGVDFLTNSVSGDGGGALALGAATVDHATFAANQSGFYGGGLNISGTLTMSSTWLVGNIANTGGGLYLAAGDGRIVNSLFAGNTATSTAALQLYLAPTGALQIIYSTVGAPNLALGDAVRVIRGSVQLYDTLVTSHSTGLQVVGGTVTQDYNLLFGNTTAIAGATVGGAHNASGDPRFAAPGANDYHLRAGSPAINAGADLGVHVDVDGQARPFGGGFEIGYDEFTLIRVLLPVVMK